MAPFRLGTAAVLAAALALAATPSFAQRQDKRQGDQGGRREGARSAQPRTGGEARGRGESQRQAEPRRQAEPQRQVEQQRQVEPQRQVERQRQVEPQGRAESQGRIETYRGSVNRPQGRVEARGRVETRGYNAPNRGYDNRAYNNRGYNNRSYSRGSYGSYGYRPYVNRTYVVPYGYRPYGYRPGWSLNLYFGRPLGGYGYGGYPAYGYGYPSAGYGYYSLSPGRYYGSVRIVDAPRGAQVFVDGYYAGVVDDYDGIFQRLNLEVGVHHIEIENQGYPPMEFDVRIEPGQTITIRADIP